MFTSSQLGNYGRLGNQMWQIASTIGLAYNLNTDTGFPKWKYADRFNCKLNLVQEFYNFKVYEETSPYYDPPFLDIRENWDLRGYFQSWKYFMNCEWDIKNTFNFKNREPVDYVSIHVRRGDYLNYAHLHTNLSKTNYYNQAINKFPKTTQFLVFSDDVLWCEGEFYNRKDGNRFLVIYDTDEFDSMSLMSSCKSNIIANSSFSWWGAYLNINPNAKVIYPSKWVESEEKNDRIPVKGNWERIELCK